MCNAAASVASDNSTPISKFDALATNGAAKPAAARPFASVFNRSNLRTTHRFAEVQLPHQYTKHGAPQHKLIPN